jgi:hypothetical protein
MRENKKKPATFLDSALLFFTFFQLCKRARRGMTEPRRSFRGRETKAQRLARQERAHNHLIDNGLVMEHGITYRANQGGYAVHRTFGTGFQFKTASSTYDGALEKLKKALSITTVAQVLGTNTEDNTNSSTAAANDHDNNEVEEDCVEGMCITAHTRKKRRVAVASPHGHIHRSIRRDTDECDDEDEDYDNVDNDDDDSFEFPAPPPRSARGSTGGAAPPTAPVAARQTQKKSALGGVLRQLIREELATALRE